MCGICGVGLARPDATPETALLRRMNDAIAHRGPDDEGYHTSPGVGLAMRRLKIIDLEGGHQPIYNEDGTIAVVFNGEIYDFDRARDRLLAAGHQFRTHSDTEVLVHLYEEVGDAVPEHVHGMFAFAIWDAPRKRLLIARDRLGKKPLHYTLAGGDLVFGSELKCLLAHPGVTRRIDPTSLARYLHYEFVPSPDTIFAGVHKLPPAGLAVWQDGKLTIRTYWDIPRPVPGAPVPDEEECAREVARITDAAVRRRLVSDVPLGIFLSGGIDSSTVAYFAAQAKSDIQTFNIRFEEKSFDESVWARRVAEQLGTRHFEETLNPEAMLELAPRVAEILDEPLGDASILPTYLLARYTRRHVTVALGGDGGDELFAGYPTYQAQRLVSLYRLLPAVLRKNVIERAVGLLPVSTENISLDFKVRRFVAGAGLEMPLRNSVWLGSFAPEELDVLAPDVRASVDWPRLASSAEAAWEAGKAEDPLDRALYLDMKLYLQDDILVKVDRATMACSLEARAPLLDTELVEFVSRLPARLKLKRLRTKNLLKAAMRGKLPDDVLDRPKKGFGIPVAQWAKRELRPLFEEQLSAARIRAGGYFDDSVVSRLLREHLDGRADHRKKLWTLLVFQLWHERWTRA
ncbi:MAG: asparagine synthase (glutamine-hydrolyzing) [Candidatus Wallbacteria bacterium]|nr:asparagine synthase (glutamine-hydrolyzing) [Candidatus Wallbacteria bacterium]